MNKEYSVSRRIAFALTVCCSILQGGAFAVAQIQATKQEEPASPLDAPVDAEPVRPSTFAEPMNFSERPTIPVVETVERQAIVDSMIEGIDFMIGCQNDNGSWGSATRTKDLNIYAPVPGAHHAFRAATTSLGISALVEMSEQMKGELGQERLAKVDASLTRAEAWLLEHLPNLRRAGGDAIYNVWGHGYSIQALVRLHRRHAGNPEHQAKLESLIRDQFDKLARYESVDGGWGYYDFRYQAKRPTSDSISFVGGTVLVALHEAKSIGIEPTQRVVERAIAALKRQRKADFSYLYGEYLQYQPMRAINRPGGSLGRSQCCNLALRLWGDEAITDNVIEHWLVRLYLRNGWLDIGRKRPIPHEAWFQVAGYFYYYGHYYAALSLEQLPAETRPAYQNMLATLIIPLQEKNGSWWDYPLYNYHEPYGTALALMTLVRCVPEQATE